MPARRDHLERAVLEVLWRAPQGVTAADVLEALAERSLALTTVLTVLERLRRKGLVEREREGRSYRHVAARSREELTAEAMLEALGDSSDRALALARFVQAAGDDDVEALRALLGSAAGPPPPPSPDHPLTTD